MKKLILLVVLVSGCTSSADDNQKVIDAAKELCAGVSTTYTTTLGPIGYSFAISCERAPL